MNQSTPISFENGKLLFIALIVQIPNTITALVLPKSLSQSSRKQQAKQLKPTDSSYSKCKVKNRKLKSSIQQSIIINNSHKSKKIFKGLLNFHNISKSPFKMFLKESRTTSLIWGTRKELILLLDISLLLDTQNQTHFGFLLISL